MENEEDVVRVNEREEVGEEVEKLEDLMRGGAQLLEIRSRRTTDIDVAVEEAEEEWLKMMSSTWMNNLKRK